MNSNGVISFGGEFTNFYSQPFPYADDVIIVCLFWTDLISQHNGTITLNSTVDTNKMNRVTQLIRIQESFGYSFVPTGVFTVTWDAVPYYGTDIVRVIELYYRTLFHCRQTPSNVY